MLLLNEAGNRSPPLCTLTNLEVLVSELLSVDGLLNHNKDW